MEELINIIDLYKIPNVKKIKDNIIYIPNNIIKFKNANSLNSEKKIHDFAQKMNDLISNNDENIIIYLFNFSDFNKLCINISKYIYDNSHISIIYSIDQINVGYYYYMINQAGVVWSLISNFQEYFEIFKTKPIYITLEAYNRACVMLTQDEYILLTNYNIIFDIPDKCSYVHITANTFNNTNRFIHYIKLYPLIGGQRKPLNIIENITYNCNICNNIVYIDKIHQCLPIF